MRKIENTREIFEREFIGWGTGACFKYFYAAFPIQIKYLVNSNPIDGSNAHLDIRHPLALKDETEVATVIIFSVGSVGEIEKTINDINPRVNIIAVEDIINLLVKSFSLFYKYKSFKLYSSYSQYGEDLLIRQFFDDLKIEKPTYLDIGANHPIRLSNTYLFYLRGSRGVLIEPNKDLVDIITDIRPRDTLLSVGIAGRIINNSAIYHTSSAIGLNSFIKENIEWHERDMISEELITLVSINDVMTKHFEHAPDFISLDVEGMELDILDTLDFERFRAKLLCIEIPFKKGQKEEIYSIMQKNDYCIMYEPLNKGNVIFVDKQIKNENKLKTY